MNDQHQLQRRINDTAAAQIPSSAWDSTVPIVIAHEGAIHHFGTGTLFRVADHFFLVTAGHVINRACANDKTVGIGGATDGHFIALTGHTLVSSKARYATPTGPLDIALHHLDQTAVDRLSKAHFLLLDDIEFDEQSPTAVYTVFGYPDAWSSPSTSPTETVTYKALQYTAYRYGRDTSTLPDYQERYHLLLDAQLQQATNQDATPAAFNDHDGQILPFPGRLHGISGASVWRIGDLNVPLDDWNTERSRLVAVQTSVYPDSRAIKATRWIAVSTMIHSAFPELRPAMELWRLP